MKIGSITEDLNKEMRIDSLPEIAKKLIGDGFEIFLQKNYAKHLGIKDGTYENLNVKMINDTNEILQNIDILAQLKLPSDKDLMNLKDNL